MKKNISGIYAITNKINSKKYIGSSKSAHYRWKQNHLPSLKKGNHHNRHLQSSWNKYGEDNFKFEVIEECREDKLLEREGHWIEYYNSWEREHGYNFTRIVDGKQIFSEESRKLMATKISESKIIEDYWQTGINGEILELFNQGMSKNAIAIEIGITRSAVYSCLEQNDLHQNKGKGKGSIIKLTDEVKQQVADLREQGKTWAEIIEIAPVSETQLRRTNTITPDGKYKTDKVKRKTYRTVTPEIVKKVEELRNQGMYWEDIEKEVGVSRFALHQNGVTQKLKASRKGEKKRKITDVDREMIRQLKVEGKTITEIHKITDIAKSTIRLQLKHIAGVKNEFN